jgi:cytidine deaminase
MNDGLQEIASATRLGAYAPYATLLVGAALLSASVRIFARCNVENVSLGLTLCTERGCVGMAVAQEERHFKTIKIVITWTLALVMAEFMLQELLLSPKQGIWE